MNIKKNKLHSIFLQRIHGINRIIKLTNSPAIDPLFQTTEINDTDGNNCQYLFFWTGTAHLDGANPCTGAVYIAFGEGQGKMNGNLMDVHGAGCQRSDPKSGNRDDYPQFPGPQGDVRNVYNYVRCVRDILHVTSVNKELKIYPNPATNNITIDNNRTIENISVYAIQGVKVLELKPKVKSTQINTSKFSNGIYFVSTNDDLEQMLSEKIIVKK